MKNNLLSLIAFFSFFLAQNASAFVIENMAISQTEETMVFDGNPVGVWDYTVTGAGPEYEKGVLFIRKDKSGYVVEVNLGNGTLTGQDVQIEGSSVKFNIILEGTERVSVVLQVVDDSIVGKSYSSQGTYNIQGTRKIPRDG
jgi:hypothetical protein